ncbi:hypothetical protein ACEN4P_03185 [Marinilactibacillus psychrotolerans]|uniref:hypothetical protein n=1 Tax=Marinilactibacillus psychrotolerans TaxID=191770 RepID=UPI00388989E1
MHLLFIVVIVDIVTAIAKHLLSPEAEDLDSSMGFKELIKHILLISLVLTFYIYCSVFDLKSYSQVFILLIMEF